MTVSCMTTSNPAPSTFGARGAIMCLVSQTSPRDRRISTLRYGATRLLRTSTRGGAELLDQHKSAKKGPVMVPAARSALRIIRYLAEHNGPVRAASLARDLDL